LKPFELLIKTFSLPRYRDLDPTPFVAIIFLAMYGFMFGDMGHGGVLVLLGLFFYFKVPSIRDFAALMTAAGLSSVFFGFMFGSFFGIEMKPIWYKPIDNIPFTMILAIGFGISVLLLGMLFQSIQRLKRRDWLNLFLGPWGIAISSVYGLMIGMSAYVYFNPGFVVTGIVFFITAAFLLFTPVVLQVPVLKLLSRIFRRDIEVHGDLLESVAEATESGLSYFTNTLSFIRVAAFGLNHAALSAAVFAIADAIKQAGVPSSGIDIVVGNLTVIVLEGMIVGIQCIRLLYYEFFTKFYRGGGIPYQPITNVGLVEEVTGS
jgi:V/A-type H+/Na+-transporting ATPase subunit I